MDREAGARSQIGWADPADRDHVVVLRGVSWDQYVALNDAQGGRSYPRMAYLDGELEVMTLSARHELVKTLLARLVEAYAEETNLELIGLGSTTWRSKAKRAGLEPDECYCIDKIKKRPDLAIEVVNTTGGIDKLEIYRRLGVAEVWFWIAKSVHVYRLGPERYRRVPKSVTVRGIDLTAIARLIATADVNKQTTTVRAYRQSLRNGSGNKSR